jgi:trehalose 6-phosphate synthase
MDSNRKAERGHSFQGAPSPRPSSPAPSVLSTNGRLLIVANRLETSIIPDKTVEGGYRFVKSSGGLASALKGCKKSMDFTVS